MSDSSPSPNEQVGAVAGAQVGKAAGAPVAEACGLPPNPIIDKICAKIGEDAGRRMGGEMDKKMMTLSGDSSSPSNSDDPTQSITKGLSLGG